MTRLVSCLGLLSATLCACGTNDHPTTPPPPEDAATPDSGVTVAQDSGDAGTEDSGADGGTAGR